MNICFYTDQTISCSTGGIGRITSTLTDYVRNIYKWRVFSIYAFEAPNRCIRTQTDGAIRLRLHDRWNIRRDVKHNYNEAVTFIVGNQIDCIIVQTSIDVVNKLRKKLDKQGLNKVKIIFALHFAPGTDEWSWKGSSGIKGLFAPIRDPYIRRQTKGYYKSAYHNADKVALLSPSYIDRYQKYADLDGNAKFIYIPNCLSFGQGGNANTLKQKKPICLVVARMEEAQKRISLILNIWSQIETPWKLVIVGTGSSLPMYKEMAERLKLKNVSFEGLQDPIPYYQQASIFLMTSAFEGFPMTILEAQQFGCVPIAYNSFSALSDVITDNESGFITEDRNEKAFIQRLSILMNDDTLRNEMGQKALNDCMRFKVDAIADLWHEQILSLWPDH